MRNHFSAAVATLSSPAYVAPCLPVAQSNPPSGTGWLHEVKLDGVRLQILKHAGSVRLYNQDGRDWTRRFPDFALAFLMLPCRRVLLDGELVTNDARPLSLRDEVAADDDCGSLTFCAFDLLHLDGRDLRDRPLSDRKDRLRALTASANINCLTTLDAFPDGDRLLQAASGLGFGGVVSKQRDASYASGRQPHWIAVPASSRPLLSGEGGDSYDVQIERAKRLSAAASLWLPTTPTSYR
jgi:bifunctional non-homologous end joining protein LigD